VPGQVISKLLFRSLTVSVLLAGAILVCYSPVRLNGFVNYDDQQYIYENQHVLQGLGWSNLIWALRSGFAANWHPLTWLSHMLDVQLWGLNAGRHHLMNVGFHIANTLLLLRFLVIATGAFWRSTVVAALFALHPLHVESVAWAAERKDVLSTFFGLLALIAYVRYASVQFLMLPPSPVQGSRFRVQGSRFWYGMALAFFALSLMSKPMLVTLPFLLLLLDFWPLARLKSLVGDEVTSPKGQGKPKDSSPPPPQRLLPLILEKLPFFALSLSSCIITAFVQRRAMVRPDQIPLLYRCCNAAVAYVRYLAKAFWPTKLSVIYLHPNVLPLFTAVAAVAVLTVLSWTFLRLGRRRPYLPFGWFWFLGSLVPVIGLVQVGFQAMADRYTYVPLFGIFVIIAWAAADWTHGLKPRVWVASTVFTVALVACGTLTFREARFWKNTETLFTHALNENPDNWVAHQNLALESLVRYQTIHRGTVETQLLNNPAETTGKSAHDYLQQIILHCEAALAVKPTFAEAHITLGKALAEAGRLPEAQEHLEAGIRSATTNAEARQELAEVYARQGRFHDAVSEYKAALQIDPEWEPVMNNLAWMLATSPEASIRDGAEAVRLAERACQLTSSTNLWFLHTLAAAYAEHGDFSNAVSTADTALHFAAGSGNTNLVITASNRLELYRARRPLRDPPP